MTNPKEVFGIKKAPMSTVPVPVLLELGIAMQEGACKYGRHNYRTIGTVTTPPPEGGGFSLRRQRHEHEDFASRHD